MNITEKLLLEIPNRSNKQREIAAYYAIALDSDRDTNTVDWPIINKAIIKRWSATGLRNVKERAWDHLEFLRIYVEES